MSNAGLAPAVSMAASRDPNDMTDKFNTRLTDAEEKAYQRWAKEHGRENDTYDYDLRGAWKELQSGTMSEDDRGHLGDKYKKPNHPTFSVESKYSSADHPGGTWTEVDGKVSYTPSRYVLRRQGVDRLRRYFEEREKGVALNIN